MNNDKYSETSTINTDQAKVLLTQQSPNNKLTVDEMYKQIIGGGNDFGIRGYQVPYTENPKQLSRTASQTVKKDILKHNHYALKVATSLPSPHSYNISSKWERHDGQFKKCNRDTFVSTIDKLSKKLEKSVPGPSMYKKEDFIHYQHKPLFGKIGKSIGLSQNSTINFLSTQSPDPGVYDTKNAGGINSVGASKQSLSSPRSPKFKQQKQAEYKSPISKNPTLPGPGSYEKANSGQIKLMPTHRKTFITTEKREPFYLANQDFVYGKEHQKIEKYSPPGVGKYDLLKTQNMNNKFPLSTGPHISHLGKSLSCRTFR